MKPPMSCPGSTLPRPGLRRQGGTSLLEVLISMVLLSVGLLAMAGLSGASASYNKLAQIRGTAAMLINDYAERARTNRAGFDAGNYSKTSAYAYSKTMLAENTCTNASTDACTVANLATLDQNQWINLLRTRLPGGDAYVLTSSTAVAVDRQRDMDIWIMWTEKQLDTGLNLSQSTCPAAASAGSDVKCMYFKVSL